MTLRPLVLSLLAIAVGSTSIDARAYCRLTTDQDPTSRCPDVCVTTGTPLAWQTTAVYTFNDQFIPGMDEATVRRIYADSFNQWTETDCIDGPIDLAVEQDPETTPVDAASTEDGLSVMVYRDAREWAQLHPGASRAFALTCVAYTTGGARLVGADMELNGGIGTFTECPAGGCAPGEQVDLANVVTHEAGHFFGLAHSDVPGSTMYCDAEGWQVDKRSLEADDIDGICAAYGSIQPDSGGCAAGPDWSAGAWWLALLAWVIARGRSRAAPHAR